MRRAGRKYDMQKILNDYIAEHGDKPVDPNAVYQWAQQNKRWEPETKTLRQRFKEELARAAREETFTDSQGRTVRRKHAVVLKSGRRRHQGRGAPDGVPGRAAGRAAGRRSGRRVAGRTARRPAGRLIQLLPPAGRRRLLGDLTPLLGG